MEVSVLGGGNEVGASCLHIKLAGTSIGEFFNELHTFVEERLEEDETK